MKEIVQINGSLIVWPIYAPNNAQAIILQILYWESVSQSALLVSLVIPSLDSVSLAVQKATSPTNPLACALSNVQVTTLLIYFVSSVCFAALKTGLATTTSVSKSAIMSRKSLHSLLILRLHSVYQNVLKDITLTTTLSLALAIAPLSIFIKYLYIYYYQQQ